VARIGMRGWKMCWQSEMRVSHTMSGLKRWTKVGTARQSRAGYGAVREMSTEEISPAGIGCKVGLFSTKIGRRTTIWLNGALNRSCFRSESENRKCTVAKISGMLHLWSPGQDNRFAANKQSSAVPNVTVVQ
jgi:hypothetical protein